MRLHYISDLAIPDPLREALLSLIRGAAHPRYAFPAGHPARQHRGTYDPAWVVDEAADAFLLGLRRRRVSVRAGYDGLSFRHRGETSRVTVRIAEMLIFAVAVRMGTPTSIEVRFGVVPLIYQEVQRRTGSVEFGDEVVEREGDPAEGGGDAFTSDPSAASRSPRSRRSPSRPPGARE